MAMAPTTMTRMPKTRNHTQHLCRRRHSSYFGLSGSVCGCRCMVVSPCKFGAGPTPPRPLSAQWSGGWSLGSSFWFTELNPGAELSSKNRLTMDCIARAHTHKRCRTALGIWRRLEGQGPRQDHQHNEDDADGHKPGGMNSPGEPFFFALKLLLALDPLFPFLLVMLVSLFAVIHDSLLSR